MKVNVSKLDYEIRQAGIPIHGVSSDGRIDFKDKATKAQKTEASAILKAHDPIWYVEERRKLYPSIQDQLDQIFHDKESGTNKWFDEIKAIKLKYPKQ